MKFTDFVGNEKIKQQLSFLQASGRLPHAFVIEGEQGMGKRTLAREIALNLFCRGEDKPCRQCPQCSKVLKNIHPDIYEYSATGGARSFHVDVVRDVKDNVYVSPNEADYKIYILGNCQCMNESAQNALLKVLEEPPEYAVFFLTVDNKSALLETVLSRSTVISVEGVSANIGADYICSHNPDIDYEAFASYETPQMTEEDLAYSEMYREAFSEDALSQAYGDIYGAPLEMPQGSENDVTSIQPNVDYKDENGDNICGATTL